MKFSQGRHKELVVCITLKFFVIVLNDKKSQEASGFNVILNGSVVNSCTDLLSTRCIRGLFL